MTWVASGIAAAGTLYSAYQQNEAGKAENERRQRRAKLLREQAIQERASGQHASEEQRRRADIIISNAQATVAASGGGTVDPSIMRLIAGLTEEGTHASTAEKYQSETAAQGMEAGSDEEMRQGSAAQDAGRIAAIGTLIQGGAQAYSMYDKYNPDVKPDNNIASAVDEQPNYSLGDQYRSRKNPRKL